MTSTEESSAGAADLLRLAAALVADRVARPARSDPGGAVCRWARGILTRGGPEGGGGIRMRVLGRDLLLVGDAELSAAVLEESPAEGACPPGRLKREAMAFLAPGALTTAHGEDWARLRPFHERVLELGDAHPFAEVFLARTRAAFSAPVRSREDVRAAMGRAMVGIVLGEDGGEGSPLEGLPRDVHALFGAVQSPVRRKLLGFRYRARRERLYGLLRSRWAAAGEAGDDEASLVALARRHAPAGDADERLQQVPHWMFTFTGSGTDLLTRALVLITSRADVHRRVREEIAETGPPQRADAVTRLAYTEACLLEAGRLFPPVTRTFHEGRDGRAGTEIVHYFPLLHRDEALGPTVHGFRPERWLGPAPDEAAAASNLFLRGPRACPGRSLILFVCKAALARQIGELGIAARAPRLSRDPLPITFPEREARFTVRPRGAS